jgi:hypothetical protein
VSDTPSCTEDGGALYFDLEHPIGIGRLRTEVGVLICKTCDGMFATQSDGNFSRAEPPSR